MKMLVTAAEVNRGKFEVKRGNLEVGSRSEMRKWEVEVRSRKRKFGCWRREVKWKDVVEGQ